MKIRETEREILKLDKTKTSHKTDIPTRIIKENIDILKLGDVTSLHKKGRKNMKGSFMPVSTLPSLSKNFEKCMFAQMSTFFDNIFSNQQCGFPKGYSTQHWLLVMLETWK